MDLFHKIQKKFEELFKETPYVFRSPGRVNLIGEHTDYNMGFVLPAAIDKVIYLAIAPGEDSICKIFAMDMNDYFECSIKDFEHSEKLWPNYLLGVIDQIKKRGFKIKGFNCVFGGNIPIGAGLSSSAALEAGLAFALNYIFNLNIEKMTLVKLAQKAENEFVGVKCGIMDQYINIFGKSGHALQIDCRTLESKYFPFDYKNISIVLFDTNVSHSLATTEYNQRRKECSEGTEVIKKGYPEVSSLRDVSIDMIHEYSSKLNDRIYRRCKYVVEENERLLRACDSLTNHDLKSFGKLMYKTHEGLTKDYEVSCKELDFLVDLIRDEPGVYGSRMMGGGFGGCTINLIENDFIEPAGKKVKEEYKKMFGIEAKIYITKINSGTSIIKTEEDDRV